MNNRYIEKRSNGDIIICEGTHGAEHFIAKFTANDNGGYTRAKTIHNCGGTLQLDTVEEIRKYYGIPLHAYVYYKAIEQKVNGEYIEIPQCYEIEEETAADTTTTTQYPITVTSDGSRLVPDTILQRIAALKNRGYIVTILY